MTVAIVRRRSWFYPAMGVAIATIIGVGFARTYYLKAWLDPRPLSLRLHVHGLVMTAWIVLFLIQTGLIAARRLTVHRTLGLAGAALAALAVITTYAAAFESATHVRGILSSVDRLYSNLLLVTLFGLFVAAGVVLRRRPAAHKRLMLLALIAAVGPGANRAIVLLMGRPVRDFHVLLISALVLLGVINDWRTRGRPHPVLFSGGALLVASQLTRRIVGGSDVWAHVGHWLLSVVSAATYAQVTGGAAAHIEAAKAAAGTEYSTTFDVLCNGRVPPGQPPGGAVPPRAQWYAAPVHVFDNLYFVGMNGYSAWAVNTSGGIILIDTLFAYAVEDEIVSGLTTLGLDPGRIKYAIVTHAHADHAGGARYLQDHYGTRIILGAADWDLLETDSGPWAKPKRDLVATDGQRLTLGDTTLTLYLTPGHTLGTVSILIPVKDGGAPHLAAEWGGTGFTFTVTPERPRRFWLQTYAQSAERFRDIVDRASADVLISNHSIFDGSRTKLPAIATRKAGEPHPYVIGNDAVRRFFTVSAECAMASSIEK